MGNSENASLLEILKTLGITDTGDPIIGNFTIEGSKHLLTSQGLQIVEISSDVHNNMSELPTDIADQISENLKVTVQIVPPLFDQQRSSAYYILPTETIVLSSFNVESGGTGLAKDLINFLTQKNLYDDLQNRTALIVGENPTIILLSK